MVLMTAGRVGVRSVQRWLASTLILRALFIQPGRLVTAACALCSSCIVHQLQQLHTTLLGRLGLVGWCGPGAVLLPESFVAACIYGRLMPVHYTILQHVTSSCVCIVLAGSSSCCACTKCVGKWAAVGKRNLQPWKGPCLYAFLCASIVRVAAESQPYCLCLRQQQLNGALLEVLDQVAPTHTAG